MMNFLSEWSTVSLLLGFCAPEVNRFLALYWNLEYNERVKNGKAVYSIVCIKMFALATNLLDGIVTGSMLECPSVPYEFQRLRSSHPILMCRVVYIMVTISIATYVFQVAKKVENTGFSINSNPQGCIHGQEQQDTAESNLLRLAKIGLKVVAIDLLSPFSSLFSPFSSLLSPFSSLLSPLSYLLSPLSPLLNPLSHLSNRDGIPFS